MFGLFRNTEEYDIDENNEMFHGIQIVGYYHDRNRIKGFLRKYWNTTEVGWTIQNRLRLVDISKPRREMDSGGTAFVRTGRINICYDKDNDWLHWAMGHELGHLYGFTGNKSGEIAADNFADEHIYRRPKYRYSKQALNQLFDGPARYSDGILSDKRCA